MRKLRTYYDLDHDTESGVLEQVQEQRARLARRLASVGAVIGIASGKGGVGKSALTANLAAELAGRGAEVGAVDADLNGPSLGRMLGVAGARLVDRADGVEPPRGAAGVRVMSMELLQASESTPLRWRAPETDSFVWQSVAETSALREFISDVAWGPVDYLLVDLPPGTDKITRFLELIPSPHQMVLVTTPSEISRFVVAKSATLMQSGDWGDVGIVANMTAFMIPETGQKIDLFPGQGARRLVEETGLPLWAEVPFDPRLGATTDVGRPIVMSEPGSAAALAIRSLADRLERQRGGRLSTS